MRRQRMFYIKDVQSRFWGKFGWVDNKTEAFRYVTFHTALQAVQKFRPCDVVQRYIHIDPEVVSG